MTTTVTVPFDINESAELAAVECAHVADVVSSGTTGFTLSIPPRSEGVR